MNKKRTWWSWIKRAETQYYSPNDTNHRGGEVDDRTFGNVWTRVWRNRNPQGDVYYSFTQHRLYESRREIRLAKSFLAEDANDIAHGASWAGREIQTREFRELSLKNQDRVRNRLSRLGKQLDGFQRKQSKRH